MANKTGEIGKEALYQEVDAEFEQLWREQVCRANPRDLPLVDRLICGLGSITIGVLIIAQALVG